MDDTPQVNMETDVSSTTGDVPESQEVTQGNVEMVIVVEQVVEEDMDVDKATNSLEISEKCNNEVEPSLEQSLQNDVKSLVTETSPSKFSELSIALENNSAKRSLLDITPTSSLKLKDPDTAPEEIVESSSKRLILNNTSIDNSESEKPAGIILNKTSLGQSIVNESEPIVGTDQIKKSPLEITGNFGPDKPLDTIATIGLPLKNTNETEPNLGTVEKVISPLKDTSIPPSKMHIDTNQIKKTSLDIVGNESEKLFQSTNNSDSKKPLDTVQTDKSPFINIISNNKPVNIIHIKKNIFRITDSKESGNPNNAIEIKKSPLKSSANNISGKLHDSIIIKKSPLKNSTQIDIVNSLDIIQSKKSPLNIQVNNDSVTSYDPIVSEKLQLKRLSIDELTTSPIEELAGKSNTIISNNKKEEMACNISVDICEKSNDLQVEVVSDMTEKDHNKSISRELKSLIKSAKESKIISECTQLTSKTRKSRVPLDVSNTCLNTVVEADKISSRRSSNHSQNSENTVDGTEKVATKRSMRSQNPEFVNKVKQFLNSVRGKCQKDSDDERSEESKKDKSETTSPSPKRKKQNDVSDQFQDKRNKLRSDPYCWRCHWHVEQATPEKGHPPLQCKVCPRSYHYKCLSGTEKTKLPLDKTWVCPECLGVLHAESSDTRSPAMKKISLGLLCELLQYALERMMDLNGVEPFMQGVDREAFPDYDKYVVHPMDLSLIKESIGESLYGSTEAFVADAQWILHNSIIFNTLQSKLTGAARTLVRTCRAEIGEIEACPECYSAAHARRPTWFTDVCSTPHILLWAKLKGFPYWPAKGMSVNSSGLVDVRFFGAHDRAWVPARDCFLYSEKDPNNFRTKRQDILDSMQEAEQHIRNISRKYGKFVYPPFKTIFDPSCLNEQLKMMIPLFEGELPVPFKEKSVINSPRIKKGIRSSSKNSKSSANDGDMSDGEETRAAPSRKMSGGAEIAREEEYLPSEKIKVEEGQNKIVIKKRRRSELEETIINIIDSNNTEKKKRVEKDKEGDKTDQQKDKNVKDEKVIVKPKIENNNATLTTTSKENPKYIPDQVNKDSVTDTVPLKITHKIKITRTSMAKDKDNKVVTPKQNIIKIYKTPQSNKETTDVKPKTEKTRHSRNKSLNNSQIGKADKSSEKKEKPLDSKHNIVIDKNKDNTGNKAKEADLVKSSNSLKTNSPQTIKEKIQFDDDTTLAVIARETAKSDGSGLPTISSVRSLSTTSQNSNNSNSKTIEVTIETNSESSIITPSSIDNVRNMKEAANKLEKLRSNTNPPPVGRVGVRAFARMTSVEKSPLKNNVEVEIKGEPIDFDDADRQVEKMDLMNAFRLRPVNPAASSNLRDVRMNKVLVAPIISKTPTKPPETRLKARKTFPQPRKPDERSELNGKNSMVYIPIQPPATQAPVRATRTITINTSSTVRPQLTTISTGANNIVNTLTTPLLSTMSSTSNHIPTTTVLTNIHNSLQCGPTVGNIPTTVHTVPLITSVNGQCFFSLQPVMSVGAVDNATPALNDLPERNNATLLPLANSSPHATSALVTSVQPITNGAGSDTTPEMPRLQQRPLVRNPLDTQLGLVPVPSTAGPLTAKLNQNAAKLTDFFRNLLEDTLEKVDEPIARLNSLKLQLEHSQWRHQQEIKELKHNHELTVVEMRAAYEKEKARTAAEMRRAAQAELDSAVKAAKAKQWCANCSHEAQFYCCWNTSYCDYPCQRAHWTQHFAQCTQQRHQDKNSPDKNALEKRLQLTPDNLPKNTPSPALTVGGKLANRVFSKEQNTSPKTSIIVSMLDDHSGGQAVKCVGTYKPGPPAQLPLLINKQVMSTDEGGKKVVTSGGYLIVGSGNGASLVTPRRAHTIQYYS